MLYYNSYANHWNTLVLNKRQLVGANLVPLRVEVSESASAKNIIQYNARSHYQDYCNSFKLANRYPSAFRFAITFSIAPAFDDDTLCIRMIAPL